MHVSVYVCVFASTHCEYTVFQRNSKEVTEVWYLNKYCCVTLFQLLSFFV
jgi:hypothetical protein